LQLGLHDVAAPRPTLPSPASFETLVRWRRDVRRFKPDTIDPAVLDQVLETANLAPSVGNSQPWRIVHVVSPILRDQVRANFEVVNAEAAQTYDGDVRRQYQNLKLSGFDRAPIHVCVFCAADPTEGRGLGRQTQPDTLDHSCAGFIMVLWLAARTHGIGLGWVSILNPAAVTELLEVPSDWRFIGYLLLGYPEEDHDDPELVRHGWQHRTPLAGRSIVR
jgi:5,6-dimethylbenzimidazole synthase